MSASGVPASSTTAAQALGRYFFLVMSLVIPALVTYAFSRTIDSNLIHASPTRPLVLYLHAVVFFGWLAFVVLQSTLVRAGNRSLHQKLGLAGASFGVLIPILGAWTAIAMGRLHGVANFGPFLILSFYDVAAFTVAFGFAILLRKRPEYHRRLMFFATCVLTDAAFTRLPLPWDTDRWAYAGVDALVFLGVIADVIFRGRVHVVYRYGLPVLLLGQACVLYLCFSRSPYWLKIAEVILR